MRSNDPISVLRDWSRPIGPGCLAKVAASNPKIRIGVRIMQGSPAQGFTLVDLLLDLAGRTW